ncbi:hypothetical protein LJR153_003666 [Paenibacillus sp. LjRoot153]|uniref:hypothetical protein n=1 Tax=Paenibacillus sp. LjRoot153 TaxID=3342270 RepID=UPI003ECF5721
MNSNELEKVLWSIALPGFGQLLNGKFLKGLLFIGLEFLINVQSHLNEVIIASFKGNIQEAIAHTNYQWLMFYPCVYMFAMWDAYRDAGGGTLPYAFFPVTFGAYIGTVGVIFSNDLLGAVWLGLVGMFVGIGVGMYFKAYLRKKIIR